MRVNEAVTTDKEFEGKLYIDNFGSGETYVNIKRDYSKLDVNGHGKIIGVAIYNSKREFEKNVRQLAK